MTIFTKPKFEIMSETLKTRKWDNMWKKRIIASKGQKKVVMEFKGWGISMSTQRRDLSYVTCTFLLMLRDLEKSTGKQWHYFRDVMAMAKGKYNCQPSDYPILAWWGLAESENGVEAGDWRLTTKGERFLASVEAVPKFLYSIPHSKQRFYSSQLICFIMIETTHFEKQIKTPFQKKSITKI